VSDKNVKQIRKQLRNVAQEMLPQVLESVVVAKIRQDIHEYVKTRLDEIFQMVKDTLNRIDDRQKDIQSMIVREFTQAVPDTAPAAPVVPQAAETVQESANPTD